MRVLVACERSGVVREAFRALGIDAWSCDLVTSTIDSQYHIVGDATAILDWGWDLLIAHPVCTRLANSGALRLYKGGKKENGIDPVKWEEMEKGAAFFKKFLDAPIKRKCIENPVMHGHGMRLVGRGPSQTIQPYDFGEDASKRTALWLTDLPRLKNTDRFVGRFVEYPPGSGKMVERWSNQTDSGQNKLAPSEHRAIDRAITYKGIAEAMANQWGNL